MKILTFLEWAEIHYPSFNPNSKVKRGQELCSECGGKGNVGSEICEECDGIGTAFAEKIKGEYLENLAADRNRLTRAAKWGKL